MQLYITVRNSIIIVLQYVNINAALCLFVSKYIHLYRYSHITLKILLFDNTELIFTV